MTPIISVIIPVYQSQQYLTRCCRSLFEQSFPDLEFLFIIDDSDCQCADIVYEVVKDYPSRIAQVRVLRHERNMGTSYSRQEGHNQATGDYIYHCDSDDWLEPDAFTILYGRATEERADLVYFDYVRHYDNNGNSVRYSFPNAVDKEISSDGTLCNKLIRRELILENRLQFPTNINWGEDLCMSVLLQILAKKIVYCPQVLYHYCMHSQSFTLTIDKEKYMQLASCPQYLEQQLIARGLYDRYRDYMQKLKFESKEYFLINKTIRDLSFWRTLYPECHSDIWQFKTVPLYLKVVSSLVLFRLDLMAVSLLKIRDCINNIRF